MERGGERQRAFERRWLHAMTKRLKERRVQSGLFISLGFRLYIYIYIYNE